MQRLRTHKTTETRSPLERLRVSVLVCLAAFACVSLQTNAQVVDRMLATVNGELITESDVCWELALDPDLQPLELSIENKRLMLERIIDQRILGQEAAKIPQNDPTDDQIRDYRNHELVARFGSQAALLARTRAVGLDAATLREIIARRLVLLKYIDFRFRSFVLVQPDEIERHYRDVALPRMKNRGGNIRSLDEMRAEIEKVLSDEKINAELDRFLDEARDKAQIVHLTEIK
jgi:hypothetical protein